MNQGRFVSYIYRYNRDDERCENSGFVKVQRMSRASDKCRIHIGMKDYKMRPQTVCTAYLFSVDGAGRADGEKLSEFMLCNGNGELKKDTSWNNVTGEGNAVTDYDGILIRCDDGDIYCTRWNDKDVKPSEIDVSGRKIEFKENAPDIPDNAEYAEYTENIQLSEDEYKDEAAEDEQVAEEKQDIQDRQTAEEAEINAAEEETACGRMMKTYPRLPLLDDKRFIECVRIVPQDIGSMDMANWKLGTNSFLSHGYYNYKYLMLGKILFGNKEEKYVIGVPGVYSNKEKYLANMFGFTVFIPVKNTRTMTGNFGYWIVEVAE